MSNERRALYRQLVQVAASTQYIDELLHWFAHTIVRLFNIQVVQFWAAQAFQNSQQSFELRSMACQEVTLPRYVMTNAHMVEFVRAVLNERREQAFQPIEALFSSHQANLLKRCGLNYCTAYFISNNLLLPPFNKDNAAEKVPTPLIMAVLLFFQSIPSTQLLPTIGTLLKQALLVAGQRGLLLEGSAENSMQRRNVSPLPDLSRLVPRRVPHREAMRSSNPFTNAESSMDKDALRLYSAIDGQRTLGELAAATQMGAESTYQAVQILLSKHYIQLFDTKEGVYGQKVVFSYPLDQTDDTR